MFLKAMHKNQRRHSPRVQPLTSPAPTCTIAVSSAILDLLICDISTGGIALLVPFHAIGLEKDTTLLNNILDLPTVDRFQVHLRIVHNQPYVLDNGDIVQRIGCAFTNLNPTRQHHIQTYIQQQHHFAAQMYPM